MLRNLRAHLEAFRDGAGPDMDILLDLNFNCATEGYLKILRAIADLEMFWVEIDSYNPQALAYIRSHSPHPISSCETLLGLREFLPYFREQAMDVAIVDAVWNGVWQSMKIAGAAEAFEVNVAPHNFYGHLCTMMNAHFAAAVPHLLEHIQMDVFDVFQIPYSALQPEHETAIAEAAKTGAGIVIRGGVARGEPGTGHGSADAWTFWKRANLDELLGGMSATEFMLRFTITSPTTHTTIVGTLSPEHLQENVAAVLQGPLPGAVYNW